MGRMAKTVRAGAVAVLLWTGLAGVAWLANGCVYTPVLRPPGKSLVDRTPELRDGLTPVTLTLSGGVELGGIFQSAGEGTPLILHFHESGGSVTRSPSELDGTYDPYDRFADLGCSSLAFDYRGVGRSGGSRSPEEMTADALAIYQHAVRLVEGDESRVVLRSTSLGTIMVASLLDGGARPAGVIAIAPVEAATIARRYSQQFWWRYAYWLAAPFLRPISTTSTLATLAQAECSVLVVTDPEDCFVTDAEVDQIQRDAMENATLSVVVPLSKSTSSAVRAQGFQRHMSLVRHRKRLIPAERSILRSLFGDEPIFDSRVNEILAALPDGPRAMLNSDEAALRRLRVLAMADRQHFPEAAAAAALMLEDDEVAAALQWVTSHWHRAMPTISHGDMEPKEVTCPASFDDLLVVFDLEGGPGGRWPVADLVRARALLESYALVDDHPNWTNRNVEAFALAMAGDLEEAAKVASIPGGAVAISFEGMEGFLMVTLKAQGTSSSRRILPVLFKAELESAYVPDASLQGNEVLLPLLKKAAWLQ